VSISFLAQLEVARRLKDFDELMLDWQARRDVSQEEKHHWDYIGKYRGVGINLLVRENAKTGSLELRLNDREDLVETLEYYNTDQYSYWLKSRDEWIRHGWLDWDFYLVGIVSFKREECSSVGYQPLTNQTNKQINHPHPKPKPAPVCWQSTPP